MPKTDVVERVRDAKHVGLHPWKAHAQEPWVGAVPNVLVVEVVPVRDVIDIHCLLSSSFDIVAKDPVDVIGSIKVLCLALAINVDLRFAEIHWPPLVALRVESSREVLAEIPELARKTIIGISGTARNVKKYMELRSFLFDEQLNDLKTLRSSRSHETSGVAPELERVRKTESHAAPKLDEQFLVATLREVSESTRNHGNPPCREHQLLYCRRRPAVPDTPCVRVWHLAVSKKSLHPPLKPTCGFPFAVLPPGQSAGVDAEAFRCLLLRLSSVHPMPDEPPAPAVRRRQRVVAEEVARRRADTNSTQVEL